MKQIGMVLKIMIITVIVIPCLSVFIFAYSPGEGFIDIIPGPLMWSSIGSQTQVHAFGAVPQLVKTGSGSGSMAVKYESLMFDGSLDTGTGGRLTGASGGTNRVRWSQDIDSKKYSFSKGDVLSGYYHWINNGMYVDSGQYLTLQFLGGSSYSELSGGVVQSAVAYPLAFDIGFDAITSLASIQYDVPWSRLNASQSSTTAQNGISEIYFVEPEPLAPPAPPDAPDGTDFGGLVQFDVTAKNSGYGPVLLYYEDVVNSLYGKAVENDAFAYAYYPYCTMFSYLGDDGNMWYALVVTEEPFLEYMKIQETNIDYGTFTMGNSGVVFLGCLPSGSASGDTVTFVSMTSYSNIGPWDFVKGVADNMQLPLWTSIDDYLTVVSPGAFICSFEGGNTSVYTVCSNYALSDQSVIDNPALKQSYKFSDAWAYLMGRAGSGGEDVESILQEILESLRSNDKTETVYTRIEQIYEILADVSKLPSDNALQSQIDDAVSALDEWSENMGDPDISELVTVTAVVSDGIDALIAQLGLIGVLLGAGIILGVIKVVLQR